MTQKLSKDRLVELLAAKGYTYSQSAEPATVQGTGKVVGVYDISYAVTPAGEKIRMGCTDLILATAEDLLMRNEVWTRLPSIVS